MSRPSLGTRVSEGARSGVVVGHPGRGNMVDVQFEDVPFVMRREASLLARNNPQEKDDPAKAQKHAVVQGIYESLVKKHLGRKNFRGRDGERIDIKALEKGTLSAEDVNALLSRAFAIATGVGRKQGDISRESLTRTGTRTSITSTGEALSALRGGANPKTVERKLKAAGVSQTAIDRVMRLHAARGPGESDQRLEDFEVTLTLRRAPTRSRRPKTVASEERAPARRKARNPRPPAASDFIRDAIRNVKAQQGNYLYLVRPAGSYVTGQTRDKTDVVGAEEIADFLKSLRWTEVTDQTRAMGAGFGKVRYFRAEVPRGLSAYEAILLWGELSPDERERVRVAKAFHQSRDPNAPTRYELISDIAPRKARVLHIAIGHPKDPFKEPTKRSSTVYTWFPGRITPVVQSDLSTFPVGVHPMATVKAAERVSNPRYHLRRNSTVSTAVAVAEETAVLGPRVVGALTRYGRASYEAVKAFLNSPFGSRVAATITSVAISVLGRKVVESGKLSKGEVRIVQDAIAAETGAMVPGNIITAAVATGAM